MLYFFLVSNRAIEVMFKIPTYEELEKKESEQNEANKNYKLNLFQKRKHDDNDDGAKAKVSLTTPLPEKPVTITVNNDDDEDDDLLNDFIAKNKDIIEKPTNKEAELSLSKDSAEVVFKKPASIQVKPSTSSVSNSYTSSGGGGPLLVNSKQRGNPILKHIRNVQWSFSETLTPDYAMSRNACAFFLSMKYHLLNPTYIHARIKELGRAYDLRVLLVFVDVKEPRHCIKELEKIAIHASLTMILCWNSEEVGRYLETYKAYEFKGADAIMEKSSSFSLASSSSGSGIGSGSYSNSAQNQVDSSFIASYTDFLCQIKSINKTDASTLRQTFGSIRQLSVASKQELNLCPGLGPLKVNRLHEIFRAPFLLTKK